jgi:hypothetical protein
MILAGYNFRLVNSRPISSTPGVYLYIHQATGKCFVKAMRNVRVQCSKNNYPKQLKELLKSHHSEVLLYLADVDADTRAALITASTKVKHVLSGRGVLFKEYKIPKNEQAAQLANETSAFHTVWIMTHKETGAVFYFGARQGVDVMKSVSQRMLTFNNYVMKKVSNANRVMYEFAKIHFPLDIDHWVIRDLDLALLTEEDVDKRITKLSKQHLESNEVVLNRISNTDALYYRNSLLKLPHRGMTEYLTSE